MKKPNQPVPGDFFLCPKCDKKEPVQFRGQKFKHDCHPDDLQNMAIRVAIAKNIQALLPTLGEKAVELKKDCNPEWGVKVEISLEIPFDEKDGQVDTNWNMNGLDFTQE